MTEDEAFWIQVSRRDPVAFEKLYSAHFSRVRDFLGVYLGNTPVADDLAQETFLQFWQRPNGFDPARANFRAYLFGIARKKAADWRRHQKMGAGAAISCESSDSVLLMKDAVQRLEPDLRNILWLREVEGHSCDGLALILDVPLGTVRSRLFSAREQLRRIWKAGE